MRIEIRHLTKRYGESLAVDDLSIDVEHGEMIALLGPSGCGKTTTMRSIVGLESPTSGRILVGDQLMFDAASGVNVPPNKRQMGMVFQSYAIWPHKSVFENVAFPLEEQRLGRKEIGERVDRVLKLVGLQQMANRGASFLSGGQMQRIAFARSIVAEPRVLLLDEPLSNLDAKLRESLRFELREIQQRLKITAIYVTHDQQEALALADRIAVMRAGRIVQLDTPSALYRKPVNTFVADFLGVSNIFPAKTVGRGEAGGAKVELTQDGTPLLSDMDFESDTAHVCIRPEHVRVRFANGGESSNHPGMNAVAGVVLVSSFLGSHVRYLVETAGGVRLEAIDSEDNPALPRGAKVELRIAPAHVQLLEA